MLLNGLDGTYFAHLQCPLSGGNCWDSKARECEDIFKSDLKMNLNIYELLTGLNIILQVKNP